MLVVMTDVRTEAPVGVLVRAERRVGRLVDSRWTVGGRGGRGVPAQAARADPAGPADEAGFTLVARAWHPLPDSVYGAYFVDRPPPMIALFKVSDRIGGPLFIRVLGAVACAALVRRRRGGGPAGRRRAGGPAGRRSRRRRSAPTC